MDGGDDAGDLHHQPPGWPSFLQGSEDLVQRGGLFDDERLAYDVGSVLAERQIAAERPQLPEDLSPAGGALAPTGIARPETPVMAFVDRASFPGFLDEDEFKCGQSPKHLGRPQVGVGEQSPLSPGAVKLTPRHIESQARPAVPSEPIVGAARLPIAARYREEDWEAELLEWKRKYGCPAADSSPASQGAAPAQPAQPEQPAEPLPSAPSAPSVETGRVASPNPEDGKSEPSGLDAPPRSNEQPDAAAPAAPAQVPSELVTTPAKQLAAELANAVCEERERTEERTGEEPQAMDGETKAPCAGWLTSRMRFSRVPPGRSERPASRRDRAQATLVVAKAEEPPQALDAGRKAMYTQQDLAIATETARSKAAGDNGWMSDFQEAALNVRDFFQDLRKSRDREKGRQATGPLWLHLAAQAKNLADQLDLPQLLEVLKLFCSVRYEDYELYMRLLGEVPHYVKQASAAQLAELARLMARRRLRERNYVDMVVAHLLSKIRVSEDNLSMRLMVKTANALAALECRSQPKFVEHFNRHFEHRIEELDPELCCMVSPVFMVNYMSDALRRSFLKRCAEAQAGFTGEAPIRNLACIELALRKEQHSLVASLPQFVVRYLEKVRAQSEFDKWGSVVLPTTVAPDGPRGDDRQELSVALLRKAAGSKCNTTGDVFSSDMHRDVSACLTHLGIEHENGVVTGPYLLDIVAKDMVNPSRRIIYEVNSPHHFYEGTKALVADKRLRHRLLGRLGHHLHMVNAYDWRPLAAAAKMTFLLKIQQEQQDKHSDEYKQQAAANVSRAPLALRPAAKQQEPLKLKSPKDDTKAPITVPVPPSLRNQPQHPVIV
ncbi:unnamed protein product [Effrenium voratum]|uniref:RAP domain-containing protein n=1 Tax=Effrenium voratum TaxID=2562239 RepID=A0AA36N9B4_9DINO|nr:unnamed protein product [Effrenium voratum]